MVRGCYVEVNDNVTDLLRGTYDEPAPVEFGLETAERQCGWFDVRDRKHDMASLV